MLAFSILEIWPLLAAIVSLMAILVTTIILFRRRGRAAQSACGHCGYDVRGLPTFTCPECGSDLRQVGIRSSGVVAGNPFLLFSSSLTASWKRLLLWTVAYIALLAVALYGSI